MVGSGAAGAVYTPDADVSTRDVMRDRGDDVGVTPADVVEDRVAGSEAEVAESTDVSDYEARSRDGVVDVDVSESAGSSSDEDADRY